MSEVLHGKLVEKFSPEELEIIDQLHDLYFAVHVLELPPQISHRFDCCLQLSGTEGGPPRDVIHGQTVLEVLRRALAQVDSPEEVSNA